MREMRWACRETRAAESVVLVLVLRSLLMDMVGCFRGRLWMIVVVEDGMERDC